MMTTPANTARLHVTLKLRYCDHPSTKAAAAMIDHESSNTTEIRCTQDTLPCTITEKLQHLRQAAISYFQLSSISLAQNEHGWIFSIETTIIVPHTCVMQF